MMPVLVWQGVDVIVVMTGERGKGTLLTGMVVLLYKL
jgi:hypothetical protein